MLFDGTNGLYVKTKEQWCNEGPPGLRKIILISEWFGTLSHVLRLAACASQDDQAVVCIKAPMFMCVHQSAHVHVQNGLSLLSYIPEIVIRGVSSYDLRGLFGSG